MNPIILTVFLLIILALPLLASEQDIQEPRIEKRDSFWVEGVGLENSMDSEAIMQTWIKFFELRQGIEAISDEQYGITYYMGGDSKNYCYFVGAQVASPDSTKADAFYHQVPAAAYAVFEHRGKIGSIDQTYTMIFEKFLPLSGHKPLQQDVFELYDKRFIHDSEDSILEIWIPIEITE